MSALAIKIIDKHIHKDDRPSYEQLDHYCQQWQERHGKLLEKYLKLSDKCFDLEEQLKAERMK